MIAYVPLHKIPVDVSLFYADHYFGTNDATEHCTVDVHLTHPSNVHHIAVADNPGQQKGFKVDTVNLSSDNAELMLTQLSMPFTNVLIHVR